MADAKAVPLVSLPRSDNEAAVNVGNEAVNSPASVDDGLSRLRSVDRYNPPEHEIGSPSAERLKAIRKTVSSHSLLGVEVGDVDEGDNNQDLRFEYKLSPLFVYKNHHRWLQQRTVPGERAAVDHAAEFKQQRRSVKVAVAAAHLYGALTTPGAKLMWWRCLQQSHDGPLAVKKALLLDLRIFSLCVRDLLLLSRCRHCAARLLLRLLGCCFVAIVHTRGPRLPVVVTPH